MTSRHFSLNMIAAVRHPQGLPIHGSRGIGDRDQVPGVSQTLDGRADKPVFVIVDGHPIHTKLVKPTSGSRIATVSSSSFLSAALFAAALSGRAGLGTYKAASLAPTGAEQRRDEAPCRRRAAPYLAVAGIGQIFLPATRVRVCGYVIFILRTLVFFFVNPYLYFMKNKI